MKNQSNFILHLHKSVSGILTQGIVKNRKERRDRNKERRKGEILFSTSLTSGPPAPREEMLSFSQIRRPKLGELK